MREMTTEELRTTQIEILNVVHNFCVKNGIPYWLDSGTLLGAIRHKGYIPWDDDIDIGMLRADYERFVSEFTGYSKRYQLVNIDNDPNYYCAFSKIVDRNTFLVEFGNDFFVNIDLFAFDNAPDDDNQLKQMLDVRDRMRYLYHSRGSKNVEDSNELKRIVKIIRNVLIGYLPNAYYLRRTICNAKRYMNEDTVFVGNFLGYTRKVCRKEIFLTFTDVEFEGKYYKAPAQYDEYLRAFYNNYMELPPIEKRKTTHTFKAYIRENSQ